jgi:hypothetical protein
VTHIDAAINRRSLCPYTHLNNKHPGKRLFLFGEGFCAKPEQAKKNTFPPVPRNPEKHYINIPIQYKIIV